MRVCGNAHEHMAFHFVFVVSMDQRFGECRTNRQGHPHFTKMDAELCCVTSPISQGSVDCQELRSLCAALNPASSQSVDWSALPPVVERQEAVVVLVTGVLEKGAKGAMAVYDVLNARLRWVGLG